MDQYTPSLINDQNGNELAKAYLTNLKDGIAILELDVENMNLKAPSRPKGFLKHIDATFNGIRRMDEAPEIYAGRTVVLKVLDNRLGVQIYTATISYVLSRRFHLENVVLNENIQRRNDVKITIKEPGLACPVAITTIGLNQYISKNSSTVIAVEFRDISAGGLCFFTNSRLEKDTLYQTDFLKTARPLQLNFNIVREVPSGDGYIYGCQFHLLPSRDENEIRKYVFDCQLKALAKERNK